MTKVISLLGATGSIGRQTLQVARELGLGVAALTANRQIDLLEQQVREFRPELAVLYDCEAARVLRERLRDLPEVRVAEGPEGLLEAAQLPQADTVVTAVMGRRSRPSRRKSASRWRTRRRSSARASW